VAVLSLPSTDIISVYIFCTHARLLSKFKMVQRTVFVVVTRPRIMEK